jgi:hypothetical protein
MRRGYETGPCPVFADDRRYEPLGRCTASWARLMAKVFQADALTCGTCGGKIRIVA